MSTGAHSGSTTPAGTSSTPGSPGGLALTPTALVVMGVIAIAWAALFHHFFYVQNFQAWTSPDWSHSYFVPLISVYLLWVRRAELAKVRACVFWPGLIPLVLGIACYALFQLVTAFNNHMFRGFSMILSLFGLVLLLLGPGFMRVAFLPLVYLVFGVTLAEKIMVPLTFELQLIASQGASATLNIVGTPCDLRGNVLEVQDSNGNIIPLNVAMACAGMRMVIGFVALAAAVALVAARYWWQRVVLLMLAMPVAILMNILRVATLGALSLVNPALAQGESHMVVGYILLVPAFLLYMGIAWALNRVVVEPTAPKSATPSPPPSWWRPGPINWRALTTPAVAVSLLVLASSAFALPAVTRWAGFHLKKLPIEAPFDRTLPALPVETANWKRLGLDAEMSKDELDELGTLNTISRTYGAKAPVPTTGLTLPPRPTGEALPALGLHLAYYTGSIDAVPHVPERCLVGGGFQLVGTAREVPLPLDRREWRRHDDPPKGMEGLYRAKLPNSFTDAPGVLVTLPMGVENLCLRVSEYADPKSGHKLFAGYFFVANGGWCASAEGVRLLAFDLKNDYAYYCKVQVSSDRARSAEELAAWAGSLLSDLLPEVMRCVPDWAEVERGEYPVGNPKKARMAKEAGKP